MKKRLAAFFCAAALLCTASCSGRVSMELPDAGYTIAFTEEYVKLNGNSLKLLYPVVSGYNDSSAEETVNTLSAAFAREMYTQKGLIADSDGGYTYTSTDAEVTLATTDFYSVYIAGVIESEVSGGTDVFAYTINCDLKNGVFLTTEEIVSDYDRLVRLFTGGNFEEDFGTAELEANFTRESLIEQYKSEYGIYPYVYFREGEFGVLVETLASLGGYAGLTADIRDVSGCLNTKNSSIAVLCGGE